MTVGSLLEGGFRIAKERGGALLLWTIMQLAATIAAAYAMAALLRGNIDAVANGASLESVQASFALQSFLVGLITLAVGTIISAAAQRVVLRPAEGGPGWLKLGGDEVRLFLLMLLYIIGFSFAFAIPGLFVGAFVGAESAAFPTVLAVLAVGIVAVLGTKLSLTFPLTLKRRAFAIGDGWRLTKGHFWTLFATYLVICLLLLIVSVLTVVVTEPDYVAAISQYGFLSAEAEEASLAPYLRLMDGTIDAPIVINWVLIAIQGSVGYALLGGAAATAVQQLDGAEDGLSETFS